MPARSCDTATAIALTNAPSWLSIDTSTGDITAAPTDATHEGVLATLPIFTFTVASNLEVVTYSWQITVQGCFNIAPTITINAALFPNLSYELSSALVSKTLEEAQFVSTTAPSYCGAFSTSLTYADGSALTGDPFTVLTDSTGGFTIQTSDASKVGTHTLLLQVYYTLYENLRSNVVQFDVEIVSSSECSIGTASYVPNYFYDRDAGDEQSFTFTDFFGSSSTCVLVYTYTAALIDPNDEDNVTAD